MVVRVSRQGSSLKRPVKQHLSALIWLCLPALVLIPALACNLPSRHSEGLIFPTSQYQPSEVGSIFPTSIATTEPLSTETSPLPMATSPSSNSTDLFGGLQTATPGAGQVGKWTTPEMETTLPPFTYLTQAGDSLNSLANRFGVRPDQIRPAQPQIGLLPPGQELTIPNLLGEPPYPSALLPDSAVVYSSMDADFKIEDYIAEAGGYLSTYQEEEEVGDWQTGAEIIKQVALESSINPQLLLAFLEFRSGWVRGQPADPSQVSYPIGFYVPDYHGLYLELSLVAKELNIGYYGWRTGSQTDLIFPDYTHVRLSPGLNAGSVALQTLASKFYRHQQDWLEALYGSQGVMVIYKEMFGDPWQKAAMAGPLFPPGLEQPTLELPFAPGELWSLTAGPHIAWRTGTPRGALDFAPITGEPPCVVSSAWVTASAPGLVVRSDKAMIALDLDGDGLEQTGWVLVYMHVAEQDKVSTGVRVDTNAQLGHPSCEGGQATGTHVHLARKYNGEWLAADGPLPMVLSGWVAHARDLPYDGTLEKGNQIVSARPDGSAGSTIIR